MEAQYHKGQSWDDFVAKLPLPGREGADPVRRDRLAQHARSVPQSRTADNLAALKTYNHERGRHLPLHRADPRHRRAGRRRAAHAHGRRRLPHRGDRPRVEGDGRVLGRQVPRRIETITAVKCVTTPTFPYPIRVAQNPGHGRAARARSAAGGVRRPAAGVVVIVPAPGPRFVEDGRRPRVARQRDPIWRSSITASAGARWTGSTSRMRSGSRSTSRSACGNCWTSGEPVSRDRFLASISFYSLCEGPVRCRSSGMSPDRAATLFHLGLDRTARDRRRARRCSRSSSGRTTVSRSISRIGCILGDPFLRIARRLPARQPRPPAAQPRSARAPVRSTTGSRRSATCRTCSRRAARARRSRRRSPRARSSTTLQFLPTARRTDQFALLARSSGARARSRRTSSPSFSNGRPASGSTTRARCCRARSPRRSARAEDQVSHAVALTDFFHVARLLGTKGADGLKAIQLQPLVAVRPALRERHRRSGEELPRVGRAQVRRHPPHAPQVDRHARLGAVRGVHARPARLDRARARASTDDRSSSARDRSSSTASSTAPSPTTRASRPATVYEVYGRAPGRSAPADEPQVRGLRSRLPERPRPHLAAAARCGASTSRRCSRRSRDCRCPCRSRSPRASSPSRRTT